MAAKQEEINAYLKLQTDPAKLTPLVYEQERPQFINQEDRISNADECIQIAMRNLSSLSATAIELPSSLNKSIISGTNSGFVDWFKDEYLPLTLIKRISIKASEDEQPSSSVRVFYTIQTSTEAEKIDKNLCLLLNELSGYGHIHSEQIQAQKIAIRDLFLTSCLSTLQRLTNSNGDVAQLGLLDQSRLVANLMILQHLTNQYNQYEFNRVLVSSHCYSQSIISLFNFKSSSTSFITIVN